MQRLFNSVLFASLILACSLCTVSSQTISKDNSPPFIDGKHSPSRVVSGFQNAPIPPNPTDALRYGKLIYVKSSSLLVGASVIEEKLQRRSEFKSLGLMVTRDFNSADIVLELHHDLFTKYVYTAIDSRTDVVIASGKLSSIGGTVAGKVAERFLKQLMRARMNQGT